MSKLEALCYGIMVAEGWAPGSRSWRNNNPGNIKGGPNETGKDEDFSVYPFFANGWLDLFADVHAKCTGKTHTALTPESTMHEFAAVWTGLRDGIALDEYCAELTKATGILDGTPLKYFVESE